MEEGENTLLLLQLVSSALEKERIQVEQLLTGYLRQIHASCDSSVSPANYIFTWPLCLCLCSQTTECFFRLREQEDTLHYPAGPVCADSFFFFFYQALSVWLKMFSTVSVIFLKRDICLYLWLWQGHLVSTIHLLRLLWFNNCYLINLNTVCKFFFLSVASVLRGILSF